MAHNTLAVENRTKKESQFAQVLYRLRKNKVAMAGLYLIIILVLIALISPFILPYD